MGTKSSAAETSTKFTNRFGSDPIVVVFGARNPTALYRLPNQSRLSALEDDLNHDPRVASAVGEGTLTDSLISAGQQAVSHVLVEYPIFVEDLTALNGEKDTAKLEKARQAAETLLAVYVFKAGVDAETARAQVTLDEQAGKLPHDRTKDAAERAAENAVLKDMEDPEKSILPPYFEYYLNRNAPDVAAAKKVFAIITAAYADCNPTTAQLIQTSIKGFQPTCQHLLDRALLDLPNCPELSSGRFCQPKTQWSAILPARVDDVPGTLPSDCAGSSPGCSYAILTIRMKPQAATNEQDVAALQRKLALLLTQGFDGLQAAGIQDGYYSSLAADKRQTLRNFKGLLPTECGADAGDATCVKATKNAGLSVVVAGAQPLAFGVARAMQHLLLVLIPVAVILMLAILLGGFRVRGRIWPLVAAGFATAMTLGVGLWFGTPITPAVLAAVPVLVGLGVDYSVQLVARFADERRAGVDADEALRLAVGRTGPATLAAALATVAGLTGLAFVSGIDGGPLVAVPLIAEFAVIVSLGVVLSWIAAITVALPLALMSDRRGRLPATDATPWSSRVTGINVSAFVLVVGVVLFLAGAVTGQAMVRSLGLTGIGAAVVGVALVAGARVLSAASVLRASRRPALLLVGPLILALLGWALLPSTRVETDTQRLLGPTLPELHSIDVARAQTGYGNEVDIYLEGKVVGDPTDSNGAQANLVYQCLLSHTVATTWAQQVSSVFSVADVFFGTGSGNANTSSNCATVSPSAPAGPSPSPSPSGSALPGTPAVPTTTPAPSASPSAVRPSAAQPARRTGKPLAAATATPDPTPPATPGPATPSPTANPAPNTGPSPTLQQSTILCNLRYFPLLSRAFVSPVAPDTKACPPVDIQGKILGAPSDPSPLNPDAARIIIGMRSSSVADEATVVSGIRDKASPPSGITATPTGLAALAATAYDTITGRALLFNLVPLVVVFLLLLVASPQPRRAVLSLLPTFMAAGWAPLLVRGMGLIPGAGGRTFGAFNPLTVVLGALVIALGTEFSVVLLNRFYEERGGGAGVDEAARAALAGVGRAIGVSAITLGAGFFVLALSGLVPDSLPLLSVFGVTVLIDLGLAVGAVLLVMFPVAIAWERARPLELAVSEGGYTGVGGILGMTRTQQVSTYVVVGILLGTLILLGQVVSPIFYWGILLPLGFLLTTGAPPADLSKRDRARLDRQRVSRRTVVPAVAPQRRSGTRAEPAPTETETVKADDDLEEFPDDDEEDESADVEGDVPDDEDQAPESEAPGILQPEPVAGRRVPGMTGRRRSTRLDDSPDPVDTPRRRPGVSGRRRTPTAGGASAEQERPDVRPKAGDEAIPKPAEPPRPRRRRPPPHVRRREREQDDPPS